MKKKDYPLSVTRSILTQSKISLKNLDIIHINHELDDVFEFNKLLIKNGANLLFIAVPYKYNYFKKLPYNTVFFKRSKKLSYIPLFNGKENKKLSSTDLVKVVINCLDQIVSDYKPGKGRKLLIIQDGGFAAFSDKLMNLNNFLGCIEQTASGAKIYDDAYEKRGLNYPVVTIAKSKIKTRFESTFIAQRVFEETNLHFYKINEFTKYKNIIIGGYGQIGRRLAFLFKHSGSYPIIFESNLKVRNLVERDGFKFIPNIRKRDIENSFCYIGCTGEKSFGTKELKEFLTSSKERFFLISASSKRVEFLDLIHLFYPNKKEDLKQLPFKKPIIKKNKIGIEYLFNYKEKLKELVLVAEGKPINLYRKESESVPSKAMDPVQALITKSLLALITKHKDFKHQIYYVGDEDTDKLLGINEGKILEEWAKVNEVPVYAKEFLAQFEPHLFYINPKDY